MQLGDTAALLGRLGQMCLEFKHFLSQTGGSHLLAPHGATALAIHVPHQPVSTHTPHGRGGESQSGPPSAPSVPSATDDENKTEQSATVARPIRGAIPGGHRAGARESSKGVWVSRAMRFKRGRWETRLVCHLRLVFSMRLRKPTTRVIFVWVSHF